jgi:hypothetical protein
MMGQATQLKEVRVSRRLAPVIGLLMGLAPAIAHAQTNIDEGKTPAQIFASDCANCHKSPRGLGSGKGSLLLSGFLREHYTSSREQAAALAAYVLGAGSDSGGATQGRGPKPGTEHARLPTEEPQPATRPTRQTGKPEAESPATAKLQPPANEEAKPGHEPSIMEGPGPGATRHPPVAGRHEGPPAIATRGHRKEHETVQPAQEPPAIVAEPSPHDTPAQNSNSQPPPGPSAAAPPNTDSGESAPIPRDDIPD